MDFPTTTFVKIEGTKLSVGASSIAEAKIALKELKLMKKQFGLTKREIISKQKEIRADHTHEVRTRGSMVRGGGGLGKFVRLIQSSSRDAKKANLAHTLSPLEKEQQECEAMMHTIDTAILQLQAQLLRHAG